MLINCAYKTFASAITEAKNVLKLGVRLEVTAMSKRTSTKKCGEKAWEAYERHVDIFIACGNGNVTPEQDPLNYRYIRDQFPKNIARQDLLASTKTQELNGDKVWASSMDLISKVRNHIMIHYSNACAAGNKPGEIRSGFDIYAVLDRVKKLMHIVAKFKEEKKNPPNLKDEIFVNGHEGWPTNKNPPPCWPGFLLFGPPSQHLYQIPSSNIFEVDAAQSDANIANSIKSGRKKQRQEEAEAENKKRKIEAGRGVSSDKDFENRVLVEKVVAEKLKVLNQTIEQKLGLIRMYQSFGQEEQALACVTEIAELQKKQNELTKKVFEAPPLTLPGRISDPFVTPSEKENASAVSYSTTFSSATSSVTGDHDGDDGNHGELNENVEEEDEEDEDQLHDEEDDVGVVDED